jgi:uncharacterized protein (TIGR01244 family)
VTPIRISPTFAVAGQLDLAEIAGLAAAGYTTLINNRPEGEEPGQPTSLDEADAAAAAGLAYAHIPVRAPSITPADVDALGKVLEAATGPVLAHCRSGMRSLTLYVLAQVMAGRLDRQGVRALGAELGIDLSGTVGWLDRHEPTTA